MNSSRFTHFDLHTPADPAKRLESLPECPWVLVSVLLLAHAHSGLSGRMPSYWWVRVCAIR